MDVTIVPSLLQALCINDNVLRLSNTARINEACLELQKTKTKQRKKDNILGAAAAVCPTPNFPAAVHDHRHPIEACFIPPNRMQRCWSDCARQCCQMLLTKSCVDRMLDPSANALSQKLLKCY